MRQGQYNYLELLRELFVKYDFITYTYNSFSEIMGLLDNLGHFFN